MEWESAAEIRDALTELANQLKETNRFLAKIAGEDPDAPEACRERKCRYYQHYLAHGPADLTHEGFHAAEKNAEQHFLNCLHRDGVCVTCSYHEKNVRA